MASGGLAMNVRIGLFVAGLATVLLASGMPLPRLAHAAGPKVAVNYQYYAVSGTSAVQLMRDLHLHGPTVDGAGAYAMTESSFSQSGQMVQGKGCSAPRYTIGMSFTITLPAAQDLPEASTRVRKAWRSFYGFVKKHEETHKAIWLSCAATMQSKIRALRTKTCEALQSRATQILESESAKCRRKHDAFDRSERSRLRAQPLIQQALRALKAEN